MKVLVKGFENSKIKLETEMEIQESWRELLEA